MNNSYFSEDWVKTLNIVKADISKSIFVCRLGIIQKISDHEILCKDLNSNLQILCYTTLSNIELAVGNVACILMTDVDYRANLIRLFANSTPLNYSSNEFHSINFGIIIGLIGE